MIFKAHLPVRDTTAMAGSPDRPAGVWSNSDRQACGAR
jgi:hypothetical protein